MAVAKTDPFPKFLLAMCAAVLGPLTEEEQKALLRVHLTKKVNLEVLAEELLDEVVDKETKTRLAQGGTKDN